MKKQDFAKLILELRVDLNLSQKDLGLALGGHQVRVSFWERERSLPTKKNLLLLKRFLAEKNLPHYLRALSKLEKSV